MLLGFRILASDLRRSSTVSRPEEINEKPKIGCEQCASKDRSEGGSMTIDLGHEKVIVPKNPNEPKAKGEE